MTTTNTDRSRLLPTLPDERAAQRHACLADLLRELSQHASIDTVTTNLMASHCSLDVTLRLSYAYSTDEAVDILRLFTTLIGLPGMPARLTLLGPRARGLKTVRTLHLGGHHGGTDLNDALLTVRLDVTLDTTGTEKRHDELMRGALPAEGSAA